MNDAVPIRGDIIRWVRTERGLTMDAVRDRGGPTKAYQSAVENGTKTNVSRRMLQKWLAILEVTEPFVRGAYPRYHQEPDSTTAVLPAGVIAAAATLPLDPAWELLGPEDRARRTLEALCRVNGLTPTVWAYVLNVQVMIIREWLSGAKAIPKDQVEAIAAVTRLSEKEILAGVSLKQLWDMYGPTVVRAYQRHVSAETLDRLLDDLT